MNDRSPQRPQVRDQSKGLEVREKLENPEPPEVKKKSKWPLLSFLFSIFAEGVATIVIYIVVFAIIIATYPMYEAW